jgi:hypothetical protein
VSLAPVSPAQETRRNIPTLSGVGNDVHRFSVVSSNYSNQRRIAIRVERDFLTDLEVQHLRMRAHLA